MELIKYKLGEIGKIITGKTPSTSDNGNFNGEIPFFTPSDITNNAFMLEKAGRTISSKGFASIKANTISGWSVLVGCIGSDMGNVGLTNMTCATNQQINSITEIKDFCSPIYLYYLLTMMKEVFRRKSNSTTTPILSKSDFENISIALPPIDIQVKIGSVLSSIDSKIALNCAINQNLEALAKQIYDYWFVQFDFPNEEGKPYKSSGGKMVWNEALKREIPEGWDVPNLGQITTSYQQGLIRSNNQLSDSYKYGYLKMGDLDGKGHYSLQNIAHTNATKEEISLFSLHKNDFLINVRNSKEIVGKTCLIDYVEENTLFNHMLVRMSFKRVSSFYMNLLFNTDFMYRAMDGLKQGTTTVIALYQEDLYRLPIIVPTKGIMDKFSLIEKAILNQKELLTNEILSLTKQRDELLPLLMNGQVTIE